MNRAARAIVARNPLISTCSVRFLRIAGTSASTFLAGFRPREDGGISYMWQTAPGSLAARQAVAAHGGAGNFLADGGRLMLSYRTPRYAYTENAIYIHAAGHGTRIPTLSLHGQRLPRTIAAALPGRPLGDLVGGSEPPLFFAPKSARILRTHDGGRPGNDMLELLLGVGWHPLSRALSHLG